MFKHLLSLLLLSALASARDSLLVWQDEFEVPGQPDPSRWGWDEGGSGMGNNEAQFYTRNRPANARVEGGHLVITARREDTLTCWYGPCKFTSARLVTRAHASWLYGRVDVRAKLPKGKGVWPAIWMLSEQSPYGGWPGSGEIDIMEHVGHEPTRVYGTVHTQDFNHKIGTSSGSSRVVADPSANWHVYSLEWGPDSLFIGVDGVRYHRFGNQGTWQKWPFDQRFHLLVNLAVGGEWGGAQGVDTTVFPQEFRVDWVRVHKIDRGDGPYALSTKVSGAGAIVLSPAKTAYAALDTVVASAVPATGWEFVRWSGALASRRATDTILVDHGGPLQAIFLPAGEHIENGDFAEGLGGWSWWHDDAVPTTIEVRGGEACFRIEKAGAEGWLSQFDWPGLNLVQGEVWELGYKAWASRPRSLPSNLVMDHDPFGTLSTAWAGSLGTTPARFSHRFTVKTTDALARLEFDFGTDTTSFCLDSVSLRRVSGPNAIRPRTSTAPAAPGPAVDAAGRKLSEAGGMSFSVRLGEKGRRGAIEAR